MNKCCKNCDKRYRILEWLIINGIEQPVRVHDCHSECKEYEQYRVEIGNRNQADREYNRQSFFDHIRKAQIKRMYWMHKKNNPD